MQRKFKPENALHLGVTNALRAGAPADLLWFHVPNGGRMDPRRGWWLAQMGVLPGVADLVLMREGRVLFLELKAPKSGVQSDAQKAFEAAATEAGAEYAIARTIDEAVEIIREWGCPLTLEVTA